jgi:SAM-dependent methyltransferase
MNAEEHYDHHLGDFYSWMTGDFSTKQAEFQRFLEEQKITPQSTRIALDLGAGHGIQSISLAQLGFLVKAVDFNRQLLAELENNGRGLPIEIFEHDLRAVKKFAVNRPELIVCWGDTLTHLESLAEIENLLSDCAEILAEKGKLILSFRDYSAPLAGDARFIPVKADETRILTCCLDYEDEKVRVTDLLHERTADGWRQKVSSYYKVRVSAQKIEDRLHKSGLKIKFNENVQRLRTIIVEK